VHKSAKRNDMALNNVYKQVRWMKEDHGDSTMPIGYKIEEGSSKEM